MVPPARIAVLVAALAGAVLAGCGDGAREVSAEALVSEGDEICRMGQARFEEIQAAPLPNASEAVEQTDALIQASEDELNALRDLEPPEELSEPYDRYLEARGRALEFFRRGRDAAESQDAQAYIKAQDGVAKRTTERQMLAEAVGFTVCSNPKAN